MSSISTYSTIYGSLTKKAYLTDMTFSYFMGLNNYDAVDLFSDEKKMTLIIKPTAPPPQLTTDELLIEQYLTIIFPSEHTQKRWSRDQVRELFRMHFVDNMKVTHAAGLSEINSNTALGYIRQAKNGLNKQPDEEALAEPVLKGNQKLGEKHSNFLGWFFDEHEGATLKDGLCVLRQNYKILMSESGLRSHLLKKCALTCKVFEYGELHGIYLNGQQIHVGTITFLFFERQQFGWPQGVMPGTVPKSGVFVPLLVALSKTGKLLKAAVLTPSCYDKKQEVTESELGQFMELLSADESDVLEFGGLELTPIDSTERSLFGDFLLGIKDSLRRNKLDKENMLIPRLVEAMKKSAEDAKKTHVNEGEKYLEDSRIKQQQTGPHMTEMVLLTKERTALKEEKLILLEEKKIIAGIKKKLLENERIFREGKKKFLEEKKQFEKLQGEK